ncbi:MAG: hypothetical protein JXQ73_22855 [Phycisphaerae bacterium]|nr:hypothetical protein [Phycisphaerae bacterium]
MSVRRRFRLKLLAMLFAGGMVMMIAQNCAIFAGQQFQTALNYTWFLTCDTDTLFSGKDLLLDCANVSSDSTSSSSSSTSSLADLL